MTNLKNWNDRFRNPEGTYLPKEKIIQELKKVTKSSLPVEYVTGSNLVIVAIPVSANFKI